MARVRRRRKGGPSLSKNIRVKFIGLLKCALAPAIFAAASFAEQALPAMTVTLGNTTVDLSVIPSIVLVAGGIFLFISGLRELGGIKI